MEMIGIEIAINTPSDIALVEIVTKYETGKRNMTENEYSNYLF